MTSIKQQICPHFVFGSSQSCFHSSFSLWTAGKLQIFPELLPCLLPRVLGVNEMLVYVLSRRHQQLPTGTFSGFTQNWQVVVQRLLAGGLISLSLSRAASPWNANAKLRRERQKLNTWIWILPHGRHNKLEAERERKRRGVLKNIPGALREMLVIIAF